MEGLRILLFTDVEGSTELSTRRGDVATRDLLRIHEELIRAQVIGHQGRVAGSAGDGFLVTFASARQALACAVAIQRVLEEQAAWAPHEHVRVRIGINGGEVAEDHGELYGAAVNAAARVCAQAKGDEIVVTSVVKELAGMLPGISFQDRGSVRLRGFQGDTHLHDVVWRRDTSRGPSTGRTRLIGRDAEMVTLHHLVEAALGGRGAMAMLGGEPGVGKSRLTEEITDAAARRGMLALTGRCAEMAGAPSLTPFVEIIEGLARMLPGDRVRQALAHDAAEVARIAPRLRRLLPGIPPPITLPTEHERRYLFNSVRDVIQRVSLHRPLLLVLEDLHWADEATLGLLDHLADEVRRLPVLILGTYRNVEVDAGHPLAGTLELQMRRHTCHPISVGRLAKGEVAEMIRAITSQDPPERVVATIHSKTDGNPLFVEEVVRYLTEEGRLIDARGEFLPMPAVDDLEVPDRVRAVIGRRLARLREDTRRALTGAAVIGRGFGVYVLAAVGGLDGEAWLDAIEEAERASLIVPEEGWSARYRFIHELVRDTLLTETPLPRRRRLHLRVAEVMEDAGVQGREPVAAEVAHHLVQAAPLADPQKTRRYLLLAASGAMTAAAFEDALGYARTALDLLPDKGHPERAAVLDTVASALRSLGRWDEALRTWHEAVTEREEAGDDEAVGRLCSEMAIQLTWSGRFRESLEAVGRGLAALRERRSPWRVQMLGIHGLSVSFLGRYEEAAAVSRQAVELGREFGGGVLGAALLERCVHHWFWGEPRQAVTAGSQGAAICRSTGDAWRLANGLGFLQFALVTLGRLADAAAIWKEVHPLATRIGHHGALLAAGRARSSLQAVAADLSGLERSAIDDLALCRTTETTWDADAHLWIGLLSFWRGHWRQAEDQFEKASGRELPGSAFDGAGWAFRVLARAYRQDRQGVLAMLEERQGKLPGPGQPHTVGAWTALLVLPEALAVVGAGREASAIGPVVLEALDAGAALRPWDGALLHGVAGICAAAGEDWGRAEDHYRRALQQAEELPHRLAQPEVRRWFAQMLLSRDAPDDRDEALQLLLEAVEGYRRLGMPGHLETTEKLVIEVRHPTRSLRGCAVTSPTGAEAERAPGTGTAGGSEGQRPAPGPVTDR